MVCGLGIANDDEVDGDAGACVEGFLDVAHGGSETADGRDGGKW